MKQKTKTTEKLTKLKGNFMKRSIKDINLDKLTKKGHRLCYIRSSRGHDQWLTDELGSSNQKLLTPSTVPGMSVFPCSQWKLFQRHNLERERCCWDHLDCGGDRFQWRALFKLLWFWWWVWRSTYLMAI